MAINFAVMNKLFVHVGNRRHFLHAFLNYLFIQNILIWPGIYSDSILAETNENNAALHETSNRLFNELLEIFARGSPPAGNKEAYGSERLASRIFGRNELEQRRFPSSDRNTEDERSKAWSQLTEELLKVFRLGVSTTTSMPTTTTPPSFAKRLEQLVPKFLNPFAENNDVSSTTSRSSSAITFATLPTLPSFVFTTPKPKEDTIFSRISSLFSGDDEKASKHRDGPQIDTGRNFERFIVRENAESENPLTSILGGKFKERGVEWNNGNLRFVNKQGSKLLGTDLAVHDRSVDIPIDRWLLLANELMNSGSRIN